MSAKRRSPIANIAPFGLRMQPEIKSKIEAAAFENSRSMNSEIVARLLASFGEAMNEPETQQMTSLKTNNRDKKFMLRFPDGMHDALKERSAANARTMNAEIVAIIAVALNGEGDRLARIEAKLDAVLKGGAA